MALSTALQSRPTTRRPLLPTSGLYLMEWPAMKRSPTHPRALPAFSKNERPTAQEQVGERSRKSLALVVSAPIECSHTYACDASVVPSVLGAASRLKLKWCAGRAGRAGLPRPRNCASTFALALRSCRSENRPLPHMSPRQPRLVCVYVCVSLSVSVFSCVHERMLLLMYPSCI